MIETMWNITVMDIEDTLRKSCKKILKDNAVSKDIRKKRAKCLKILGNILWGIALISTS